MSNVFSDRYEMVKHIARGGMAQVYLARDLLLDRPVALKVLFPELSVDRNFVERFRREAKAAANLTHPNIVSVYDWGQGENTYYIVMEYVDGPTLSSLLRQGPLAPERAATIASEVATALEFAHRRGVIHRDVKPGNVLIDEHSNVKVADFGIARAANANDNLTQTGSVMGTATYFSPEQAQGYPVDPRSDVYSLGVVLYEMVAGKPPFTGENPVSIAYKHVKEPAPPPSTVLAGVPLALEAIIMKALAKDPADRYASAEEMRADLQRFLAGQPVLAAAAGAGATSVMGAVPPAAAGAAALGATSVLGAVPAGAAVAGAGLGGPGDRTMVAGGPVGPVRRPPEDPSRGLFYALIALLLLALIGAAVYFGGRSAGWWGKSGLTVPGDLVGKQLPAAQSELAQKGFTNVKTSPQPSTKPVNTVISTDPGAGTSISASSPLTLVFSSGPAAVPVPNVVGQTADAANAALSGVGLKPQDVPGFSATQGPNVVLSTNPAGGTSVAPGSTVQVSVNQPVTIPSLVGTDATSAGATLANDHLTVAATREEYSNSVAAGQVTRTDPPSGTVVAQGTGVTVYVSKGQQPQVSVPNLAGDTAAQASAALSAAGLKGAPSTVAVTDPTQNGVVQSQNPTAGSSVPQGSTVAYSVGSYAAPATTTTTLPGLTTTTT